MASTRILIGKIHPRVIPKKGRNVSPARLRKIKGTPVDQITRLAEDSQIDGTWRQLSRVVSKRKKLKRVKPLTGEPFPWPCRHEDDHQLRQSYEQEMTQWEGNRRRESLIQCKLDILDVCRSLGRKLHWKKPLIYQVLAVFALRYGLNSMAFRQAAKTSVTVYINYNDHVRWQRNPTTINSAIQTKIPSRNLPFPIPKKVDHFTLPAAIEELLFRKKGKPQSSMEIANWLGLEWSKESQKLLSVSLILLQFCDLVVQMPPLFTGQKRLSVWAHAAHVLPPIHYKNPSLYILEELMNGSRRIVSLVKKGFFPNATIRNHIKLLRKLGLIHFRGRSPTRRLEKIWLSSKGEKFMKFYQRNRSIPEPMRRLLIEEMGT